MDRVPVAEIKSPTPFHVAIFPVFKGIQHFSIRKFRGRK